MLHNLDSGRGSHTAESKRDKSSCSLNFTDALARARAAHTHTHTRCTYEKQGINGREALNTHTVLARDINACSFN